MNKDEKLIVITYYLLSLALITKTIYSNMDQENKQLASIKIYLPQNSILTITDIKHNQIFFSISSPSTHLYSKKEKTYLKKYKIKCDNEQQFQHLEQFFLLSPLRRASITPQYLPMLAHHFKKLNFHSIQLLANEGKNYSFLALQNIPSQVYKFALPLKVANIAQIIHNIKKSQKEGNTLQLQFCVAEFYSIAQLLKIIASWIQYTDCKSQLEKLTVNHKSQLLFVLERKKFYGLSICVHSCSHEDQFNLLILKQLLHYPHFFSIQFLNWKPSEFSSLSYLFENYNHRSRYLVKFGHFLQITQLRVFVNTTGMKKSEVGHIFELFKLPGHYQLICHSTKQHLEQAIRIFLYKPLIKFEFFVPLSESSQLQQAIEPMVRKAETLRRKIQIFVRMLKNPNRLDLSTIIRLFLTMSKINF